MPSWLRHKTIHNEQPKITATALNNVAVAFFVTGVLTPLVTFIQNPMTLTSPVAALIGTGWLLTALIVHLLARLVLTGLEP